MKVRKKKILNTKTGSEEEKGKLKKESENFTAVNWCNKKKINPKIWNYKKMEKRIQLNIL